MAEVSWSRRAIGDLQRLYRFLEKTNPEAATRAVGTIRQSVKRLKNFPEAGRPARRIDPQIRDWIIPLGNAGCVARYRFDGQEVVIVLVRNQRELL